MAFEQTEQLIRTFQAKMALTAMYMRDVRKKVPLDDLSQNPVQALYAAHHALILHLQAEIIETFMAEITNPDNPVIQGINLWPLVVAVDNAIRSIDAAMQMAGLDIGMKEEWMKC